MSDLPAGRHNFYAAIDPGFKGAIAVMNESATSLRVWDMPISHAKGDRDRQREIDLNGLRDAFNRLRHLPDLVLAIEWPTTRPDEGAERSERFGRGKGYLEAFAFLNRLNYYKIAPNLWKGRLGLDGKERDPGSEAGVRLFEGTYPAFVHLIRGPRGGLIDGRLDALLMCHFLRDRQPVTGLRALGRGNYSADSMKIIFAKSKRAKRRLIGP